MEINKKNFEKNISIIIKKNMPLAKKLQKIQFHNEELEVTKSGEITTKYAGKYINSKYDPVKEAEVRISQAMKVEEQHLIICMGFGLGYEIEEILRHTKKKAMVLVVILDLELFMSLISTKDISKLLANNQLGFIDGTEKNFKQYFYSNIVDLILYNTINIQYFFHPVITNASDEMEKKVKDLHIDIKDSIKYRVIELGNDPRDSIEGLLRIMHNFDNILHSVDLKEVKGTLKGVPAVCIASGPSLDKNFHLLKEMEGKALLFGVESNIPKLVEAGLKFNGGAVHERVPASYYITLKDVEISDEVVFFGESVAYHKLFEKHQGKNALIFRDTTVAENIFAKELGELNTFSTGISVAHMAISLANYLGCSPIILVGQDLAFDEEGYGHTKNTVHIDSDMSAEELKKEGKLKGNEIMLPANNGGMIKSTNYWKDMLDWIEIFIQKNDAKIINATEGGAYIRGTEVMPLQEVIDTYCKDEYGFAFHKLFHEPSSEVVENRKDAILKVINREKEELSKFQKLIDELYDDLNKIKELIEGRSSNIDIDEYTAPRKHPLWKLFELKLPLFFSQSVFIEFFRKLVYFEKTDDANSLIPLYNEQADLANKLQAIHNVSIEIFNQGELFINEGKPFNEDMLELLEMRSGVEHVYNKKEGVSK